MCIRDRNGLGPWESGLSVHFVKDQREAGQVTVDAERPYVAKSDAQRFAINGNTGFVGFDKEGRSIGFKYQYVNNICLLYTSDAADERSSVDLGGRRIIKKKKR